MRADSSVARLAGLALVVAGLGAASSASAYNLIGWDWSWQSAPMSTPFYYNPTSFPSGVGTQANVIDALEGGIDRWGLDGGADFSFNNAGPTTATSFRVDGLFVAQYSNTTASGGTLAVAQSFGSGSRMTECDIRFYAANQYGSTNFRASPNGVSSSYVDLEQVVTHEFGHCAGLDHSSSFNAVMYPAYRGGQTGYRTLTNDDKNGLIDMYGAGSGGGGSTGLVLDMTAAFVGGRSGTIQVTGASSGESVRLYGSLGGPGAGPCPGDLGGKCLGVKATAVLIATVAADSTGKATFTVTAPKGYVGTFVGLQAAVPRGSNTLLSNVDGFEIRSRTAGCANGYVLDCAATCVPVSFQGDGTCDDGSTYINAGSAFTGYANLDCSLLDADRGDCD